MPYVISTVWPILDREEIRLEPFHLTSMHFHFYSSISVSQFDSTVAQANHLGIEIMAQLYQLQTTGLIQFDATLHETSSEFLHNQSIHPIPSTRSAPASCMS